MKKSIPLLLAFVISIGITSCKKKLKSSLDENPEFVSYVSAHTSGLVSKKSDIKIVTTFSLEDILDFNSGKLLDLFEIKPGLDGEVSLLNERTLVFSPENDLQSDTKYEVGFKLGELIKVPDELKMFHFEFQTIKPAFSVFTYGVNIYNDNETAYVTGKVISSDDMQDDIVEKLFEARLDDEVRKISWTHSTDGINHPFRIDSIKRTDKEKQIQISWNGKSIGIDEKGEKIFTVFPIGIFEIVSVKVNQRPEQYISIKFSDLVKKNQYLNGLIELQDGGNLSFVIDGNEIKVYSDAHETGLKTLQVKAGIESVSNKKIKTDESIDLQFESIKPAVRFLSEGVIMPNSHGLILPFEAVNLNAVDVQIIKIFENKLGQFFQFNTLKGGSYLKNVGRPVLAKKVELTSDHPIDYGQWNRFSLDLSELIDQDPGSIYHVYIRFKKSYSTYSCKSTDDDDTEYRKNNWDDNSYYSTWFYPEGYRWDERDNPCHISYYNSNRYINKNILASDLGIIAKSGELNEFSVFVTDILTAKPLNNVNIEFYNYQNILIDKGKTNNEGILQKKTESKPFLIVARKGKQKGYLKVDDGNSLSVSNFDVGGKYLKKGLKGYVYGERGVWRPGDTLFLTFILNDPEGNLPAEHPVILELKNPMGKVVERKVKKYGLNGFYSFTIATSPDALTGNWNAVVKVGGAEFYKRIKIESVKPNRLKIDLDFGSEILSLSDVEIKGDLTVDWLHGAPGKNLKAQIDVLLQTAKTSFSDFPGYTFDNNSMSFYPKELNIFEGTTNNDGKAVVSFTIPEYSRVPGMLKANFIITAYEPGGDFSTKYINIPFAPYSSFAGLKIPAEENSRWLYTNTEYDIDLACVSFDGEHLSGNDLNVMVYKVNWRWWWNSSDDDLASYFSGSSHTPYLSGSAITKDGKAEFNLKVDENDWGRYFILVYDKESGHTAGKTVYFDWPGWARYRKGGQSDAAAMIMVNTDKEKYDVGENIEISFPGAEKGRALLTIESGSDVIESAWIESMGDIVHYTLKARPEMAPNVYAYITLLQPHAESGNDRPIRMYGIKPILVEDPDTKLYPVIDVPQELRPEKEFTVKVSERNNKPMTYTLAMVDEGLLDLTNFKTPNAWSDFFSREALGVKSWDMYDYVLGAYGGRFERIFSIGGDEEIDTDTKKQVNRFKPVVKFLGPFYLNSGEEEHKIKMPNYVGAVRFMLVSGYDNAYGAVDKSVAVKSPLMILSTLPRVIGPGETVKMPVTIFAMQDDIENVEVEVKVNDIITLKENKKNLKFAKTGEKVIYFDLDIAEKVGVGNIEVIARSGSEKASSQTEIEVRNPNLPISKTNTKILEAGEEYIYKSVLYGIIGKNTVIADVSGIPTFDLGGRLDYLIRYPYGCTEQRISSVFPQLFLDDLLDLSEEKQKSIERNIRLGIDMLRPLQLYNGGFIYWPGLSYTNSWLTSYAGHFLIAAEKKGYLIPNYMKKDWIDFQVELSNDWNPVIRNRYGYYHQNSFEQAYRLYTLALAGEPEYGAMNRLRNLNTKSVQSTWVLAAAYATVGQIEVAKEMVKDLTTDIEEYTMSSSSFGSVMRDKAFILITLSLIDDKEIAFKVYEFISGNLTTNRWYSTQTTAFSLIGASEFIKGFAEKGSKLEYEYRLNDEDKQTVSTFSLINHFESNTDNGGPIEIYFKNNNDSKIFIQLTNNGRPMIGDTTNEQQNMRMSVDYSDEYGNRIDISRLEQGTIFYATVSVTNPGLLGVYKDMALSQVLPSGWEVINYRVGDIDYVKGDKPLYQDIRDDRVYTFFRLNKGTDKYVIMLSASYPGKFYLPFTYCEEMYDNSIYSRKAGQWVEVYVPDRNKK